MPSQGKKTEEERRRLLSEFERSGLSLKKFAKQVGVGHTTLWRWRHQAANTAADTQGPFTSVETGIFKELQVTPETVAAEFEVVLTNGTTVRVPAGFDPDGLRILLMTLRAC